MGARVHHAGGVRQAKRQSEAIRVGTALRDSLFGGARGRGTTHPKLRRFGVKVRRSQRVSRYPAPPMPAVNPRVVSSLVALVVSVAAARARAGDHDATLLPTSATAHAVSLADAVKRASASGPFVALALAPSSATRDVGRAAEGRMATLPHASLSLGDRRSVAGHGAEVGLSILQDFHVESVPEARRRYASALTRSVESDVDRARLDAALRASLAWIGLAEATRLVALRRASLDQASGVLRVVEARVERGVELPEDRALARAEVSSAKVALLAAEGAWFEASASLRFELGEGADVALTPEGGLETVPEPREASVGLAASHPRIKAAAARAELLDRDTELTHATHAPTVGVGASVTFEGTGDRIVSGLVSLPIPVARPQAFEVARGRAAADGARAEVEVARTELGRDRLIADHEREHTREVLDAIVLGSLVAHREAMRIVSGQLEAGTTDVSRVLLARSRLVATEEQALRALADVKRADASFLHASGRILEEFGR